ncbi:MAG TPA: DUF2723 domain-containing protein [Kofleriaceae bacterium]
MQSWRSRWCVEPGALLALAALCIYVYVAPPFIVDGDNAEFATLSATGGVAHPPGYPLYVLYLRAMSWLPGQTAAHTAALATALLGALTVFAIHGACRAWGARPMSAALATALFAGAPIVMRLHSVAEVFALNNLIIATILWLSAGAGPLRGTARVIALGLVAGLGIANQHTCVLLAPVGLYGAARGLRETAHPRMAVAMGGIATLGLGLLPYAYLLAAPASGVSWGAPHTLADVVAHFTRADYGGLFAFSPTEGEVDVGANLAAFATTVGRAWVWGPALVGVVALGYFSARGSERESRWSWCLLAATWLLAGPLLSARFNVLPEGLGLAVVQRFHLFAVVLLAVPVAVGFDRMAELVQHRIAARLRLRAGTRALAVAAVFAVTSGLSLPYVAATQSPAVERGISNMLYSMPAAAVILAVGDDIAYGTHYLQEVYGVRTDVVVVQWMQTTLDWRRRSLAARGVAVDPYAPSTEPPSVRVARQIFVTGRPMFMTVTPNNVLRTFGSYPYGMLFRVLPPGAPMPTLDEIVAINHDTFAAFDLNYARPHKDAAYADVTHQRYVGTWMILARALADAGRRADAHAARELAENLEPLP